MKLPRIGKDSELHQDTQTVALMPLFLPRQSILVHSPGGSTGYTIELKSILPSTYYLAMRQRIL